MAEWIEDMVAEVRQAQARIAHAYDPREGETLMEAAEARGVLDVDVILALIRAGTRAGSRRTELLGRRELEQLLALLRKMDEEAGS